MDNIATLTKSFYKRRSLLSKEVNDVDDAMATGVGWQSFESQMGIFEKMTAMKDIVWPEIRSVLDVGCGYGQLVEFLRENKAFTGNYTGIDIISRYIKKARQLYGKNARNHFITGDFLRHYWGGARFDIVMVLGAISVNYDYPAKHGEKSLKYAEDIIEQAVRLARKAVCVYFPNRLNINPTIMQHDGDMAFYRPEQIEGMIKRVCEDRLQSIEVVTGSGALDVKAAAIAWLK